MPARVWFGLIVDDVGSSTLQPLIRKQFRKGSTTCSDTWKGYTGIAANGYVHRLVDHQKEFANKETHINMGWKVFRVILNAGWLPREEYEGND